MGFFSRLLGRRRTPKRVFVLSISGVGRGMLQAEQGARLMPFLSRVASQSLRMQGVVPMVWAVIWATYATGTNPGRHGIFGFVDRKPNPFSTILPNAEHLKSPPLWELISLEGRQGGFINLPMSYPPTVVSGFMVCGPPATDVRSAVYPAELGPMLVEMGYSLEVDPNWALEQPHAFLQELSRAMAGRFNACYKLMSSEPWDLMQLHISEPEWVNRFFWEVWEEAPDEPVSAQCLQFFQRLDSYLEQLVERVREEAKVVVVADGGFVRAKGYVNINRWLEEQGYLVLGRGRRRLKSMHTSSRAYSLVPGRVYVNLEGREERGSVAPGRAYEELREELAHRIGGIVFPEYEEEICQRVFRREQLYSGPQLPQAPDLVLVPAEGYELGASLAESEVFSPAKARGVRLIDDGLVWVGEEGGAEGIDEVRLVDIAPTLMAMLGLEPKDMEGRSLI